MFRVLLEDFPAAPPPEPFNPVQPLQQAHEKLMASQKLPHRGVALPPSSLLRTVSTHHSCNNLGGRIEFRPRLTLNFARLASGPFLLTHLLDAFWRVHQQIATNIHERSSMPKKDTNIIQQLILNEEGKVWFY
jgi:hypothetical protein